jgi:hypothetical protein
VFLLCYFLFRPDPKPEIEITRSVIERPDSSLVTIDRRSPNIHIKSKLQPSGRQLVLDTIVNHDTLRVALSQDTTLEIRLLPAPRLVQEWVRYMRHDSIIYQREIERVYIARAWYESPLLVAIGAVLGFLVALLV